MMLSWYTSSSKLNMLLGYIMISARSEEEVGGKSPKRQKEGLVYSVCASRCQRLCIIIILNFNNVSFKLISSLVFSALPRCLCGSPISHSRSVNLIWLCPHSFGKNITTKSHKVVILIGKVGEVGCGGPLTINKVMRFVTSVSIGYHKRSCYCVLPYQYFSPAFTFRTAVSLGWCNTGQLA